MLDGELTAVVSFIGVLLQLGGEIMLVALFVLLRRYVLRRGYFAAWTAAWACGSLAILALCLRYIIMPRLMAAPVDDAALSVRALYLVYQTGKLASFALFVAGTAMYVTGTRLIGSRYVVFGAAAGYALISMVATRGALDQLIVWQAPITVMSLGACGALLFSLPASRRTLGSMATAGAFSALSALWLLYAVAFSVDASARAMRPWTIAITNFNTYLDLLLNIALGVGMVVLLMEDAKREVDDAQAELRVAHDQLQRAALYDSLTDSLNRRAFAEGVGLEMARGTFGAVVIADLDNLKAVNDTYGHAAGDALLRYCADLLRSTLRPYDKLYRWGGDEFLLVIPSARGADVEMRLTAALEARRCSICRPAGPSGSRSASAPRTTTAPRVCRNPFRWPTRPCTGRSTPANHPRAAYRPCGWHPEPSRSSAELQRGARNARVRRARLMRCSPTTITSTVVPIQIHPNSRCRPVGWRGTLSA